MDNQKAVVKVLVSPELKAQLQEVLKQNDRILSQALRDLIREYIWRTKKRRGKGRYEDSSGPHSELIRAVVDPDLKAQFETAAKRYEQIPSRALRSLICEYVHRHSRGEVWEPGQEIKRQLLPK